MANREVGERGPEIYVGYLAVPRKYRRFLWMVVPLAVGLLIGAGMMRAAVQLDSGNAAWEDGAEIEVSGVLAGGAYPVLFSDEPAAGPKGFMLVVSTGKHGSADRLAPWAGKPVRLKGTLLRRGDGRMIELSDDVEPVEDAAGGRMLPPVVERGRVVLRGEIVDSKCYLGAMKPGHGKPHKECATLCIKGGIPPVLLYSMSDGSWGSCILVSPEGGALDEAAFKYIADPVEVAGDMEEQGAVKRLRVRVEGITRR